MSRFWRVAIAAGCLLAGLLVGWLLLGGGSVHVEEVDLVAAGTLATAVATLVLGGTTVYLALQTRATVQAAERGTQVAREQLATAQRQVDVANQTLDSQTQPMLTVGSTAAGWLEPGVVHVRNVGNATAVVTQAVFIYGPHPLDLVSASAVDPAIPPQEGSMVRAPYGQIPEDRPTNFSVAVTYADASGRLRGAVRLDVYWRPPSLAEERDGNDGVWWVRQVFWDDDFDRVRGDSPKLGTQPVD